MLAALNEIADAVEADLAGDVDIAAVAARHATTEYHLRRMFSSLAGIPVSEYVRRRRMSRAAADVTKSTDDLLTIAVRHGYGSSEAFARAFRAVHGVGPSEARRDGGPFRSHQPLRFRLTVEGNTAMNVRIVERPALRLIGHAIRVSLIYEGINPAIAEHIAGIEPSEHARLKDLSNTDPAGLLQVTHGIEHDAPEGAELTYLHGVAVTDGTAVPEDLDRIDVEPGRWAVFTSTGAHPQALQETWAATASEWFPSQPWRLRPGPSMVAILEHGADFTTATCELWQPIESA